MRYIINVKGNHLNAQFPLTIGTKSRHAYEELRRLTGHFIGADVSMDVIALPRRTAILRFR